MAISLSDAQILFLRQRSQLLLSQPSYGARNVSQIVQSLCAVQAQEEASAALAIRARSSGLVAADAEQARIEERSIVRTWGPRGTLHLLATQDFGWLLSLLGPVFIAGDRRRWAELGLDEDMCARAIHLLRDILSSQGPLTRAEIVHPVVLVNGQVVGVWKSQLQKKRLNVRIEPFGSLSAEIYAGIEDNVADIGRFLGVDCSLQVM